MLALCSVLPVSRSLLAAAMDIASAGAPGAAGAAMLLVLVCLACKQKENEVDRVTG